MYKKYQYNAHTHENDDLSNDEDLEYEQSNNDSLETYNEDDEELKLSKRNSDLLEDIPLKKERSSKHKAKSIEFKEMNTNLKEEKKKKSFSNENNNNSSLNNNDKVDLEEKIEEEEDEEFNFPELKLK